MNTLKSLFRSPLVRVVLALVVTSAGVILSDYFRETSVLWSVAGFVLVGLGLLLIPGLLPARPRGGQRP